MDFCRTVWSVMGMNFRRWKSDVRIWLILGFVGMLLIKELRGITAYGLEHEAECTAYLFPFLFADSIISVGTMKVMLFLGGILLLCDAPFIYSNTPYVIMRSRREKWWISECLYIFTTVLLYMLFIMLVSMLAVLPVAVFGQEWGNAVFDFQNGNGTMGAGEIKRAYEIFVIMPRDTVGYLYPLGAHLYTFVTATAALFLLGLLQYVVNLLTKSMFWGFAAASAFIFLDPLLYYFSSEPAFRWAPLFSPLCWINAERLNLVNRNNVLSVPFVVSMFVILTVLLLVIIRSASKKIMIEVRGEV